MGFGSCGPEQAPSWSKRNKAPLARDSDGVVSRMWAGGESEAIMPRRTSDWLSNSLLWMEYPQVTDKVINCDRLDLSSLRVSSNKTLQEIQKLPLI